MEQNHQRIGHKNAEEWMMAKDIIGCADKRAMASELTTAIISLHNDIVGHLKQSLGKAIEIGRLLSEQKHHLAHGDFTPWVKANLPFTERTARNYMRLYRERQRLKTETVSDFKSAYQLLKAPDTKAATDVSWDSMTADDLKSIIDSINDDLGDPEYYIDSECKWFFDFATDMKPQNEDDLITARKIEIGKHYCHIQNLAWHRGIESVPPPWREILINDGLIPTKEPWKICRSHCHLINDEG